MLKFEIQCKTIEFSKRKAKERRQLENDTQTKCDLLFEKMCRDQLTPNEEEEYQTCKEILEDISSYREQATHIRSRVDFIEKYEKSNRYFYSKEKESYNKKSITSLKHW